MSYTINEQNIERQKLLNRGLSHITDRLLDILELPSGISCLDIGCGIGETTRHLARRLGNSSEILGLDQDAELIAVARNTPSDKYATVTFEIGDATQMAFEDQRFDFVFTRYLLTHLTHPENVLAEMFRVCKLGGIVAVQEPDLLLAQCHPKSWAYEKMVDILDKVLPHASVGRELASFFQQIGYPPIDIFIDSVIEFGGTLSCSMFAEKLEDFDGTELRRVYRMTMEALGPAFIKFGLMEESEVHAMCDELRRVELEENVLFMSGPVVTAWAKRC